MERHSGTRVTRQSRRKSLVAATFGNVVEWYEWSVYAVFAPFVAAALFDDSDPVSALLATFAVFAAGFLMRPVGGIVFGWIADRHGRRKVLVSTLLIMGAASLAIGLMPDYAAIGGWASLMLLVARMIQGFAHGGESATSNSYVAEIAPSDRRGLWSSAVFAAILGGVVLATLIGIILIVGLGEQAVLDWGWRVPFILGGVFALVVLVLRRSMEESEVFTQQSSRPPLSIRQLAISRDMLRPFLLSVGLICGLTVVQYTWISYVATRAIVHERMDIGGAYIAACLSQIVGLICLPFWGRLSDRIGRRPQFLGFAVAIIVLQFPLSGLISDQPWTLFVAGSVAMIVITSTGALQAATLSELFPTHIRTLGIGLAFSVSVAVFGGTAPYINEALYGSGLGWLANLYVMAAAGVTGISAWLMSESVGKHLGEKAVIVRGEQEGVSVPVGGTG